MDPNAALLGILWAIKRKDMDAAKELLDSLLGWIKTGGFEPSYLIVIQDFIELPKDLAKLAH